MNTSAAQPRPSRAGVVVIATVATTTVIGLLLAAVTFFALAIAFPLAGPIAEHYGLAVRAADLELARRFADFWWVFAGLTAASLAGAAIVVVKAVEHVDAAKRG